MVNSDCQLPRAYPALTISRESPLWQEDSTTPPLLRFMEEGEQNDDIKPVSARIKTSRGADDLSNDLRAYGSTPSKLPSVSAEREDWWIDQITQSQAFLAALDDPALKQQLQNPTVGNYINLPIPAYVGLTSRFSNVKENGMLPLIQRQIFTDLQTRVQAKEGLTYVHGPQGFGKSFALYHLFCALSTYPNNRVLYIPDCDMINEDSIFKLFKAIGAAFAPDSAFLDSIYPLALSFDNHSWELLLGRIKKYCETNTLTFFAIFDQHNGLKQEQRQRAPTNLLQWPKALNGPFFKLIISASANNSDQPLTKDTPSMFPFMKGLSDVELAAWRAKYAFFVTEASLTSLTELTANIPFELFEVLQAWKECMKTTPNPTLIEVLAAYRVARLRAIKKSHNEYLEKRGAALPELLYSTTEHKSMFYMINKLPLSAGASTIFDRQLFCEQQQPQSGLVTIQPTFPLVLDMVVERLQSLDAAVFTAEVFKSGLPNDAKGRAAEYYIIHAITKRGHLTLPCYSVGQNTLDTKLDLDVAVERFHNLVPADVPTTATLFVPASPKYKDIDFLLFDPSTSSLYCIQVTVQADPWKHPNTWKPGDGTPAGRTIYDEWMDFCAPTTTTKIWFVAVPLDETIQPKGKAKPKAFLAECVDHKWVDFNDPECKTYFPILSSFKH